MHDSNGSLMPEGPASLPQEPKDLRAELEALAEFIRELKQHADRVLGQSERDRAEEDRRSMHESFDRWKKESEEYDRRWKESQARWEKEKKEYDRRWEESQARWEEMQRDIVQRLKALEGRGSEGSGEEEKTEEEGTADG